MDCRKGLWLALGLWGAAGCRHADPAVPGAAPPAAAAPADTVVTRKVANGPKKLPKAETIVRYADYKAGEASAPYSNYAPSVRQMLRDDARKRYQEALEVDPKCLAAEQGLARVAVAEGDYPRAVATYQKALQMAPRNAAVWFELGMCYNRMHQWDEALKAVGQAAVLEPDNRTYVNSQGVLLARLGRDQESLACFARINGEARAHYQLGCTLRLLNQPELSKRHLELALQKNPRLEAARAILKEMTAPAAPERPARSAAPSPVQPAAYSQPAPTETEGKAGEESAEESIAGPPEADIDLEVPTRQPEKPAEEAPPEGE
jgi:tetratricopeptide (TPR) repeat protein